MVPVKLIEYLAPVIGSFEKSRVWEIGNLLYMYYSLSYAYSFLFNLSEWQAEFC